MRKDQIRKKSIKLIHDMNQIMVNGREKGWTDDKLFNELIDWVSIQLEDAYVKGHTDAQVQMEQDDNENS